MRAAWVTWAVRGMVMVGALVAAPRMAAAEDDGGMRWTPPAADVSGSTGAKTPGVHFRDRPLSLVGVFGSGTPVGVAGVAVQYSVVDMLALGGGAGTNGAGLQLEAHANFRPLQWSGKRVTVSLGPQLAYSTGAYKPFNFFMDSMDHSSSPTLVVDRAHWGQVDIGLEVQSKDGFVFRFSHGVAALLGADTHCESSRPGPCNAAPLAEHDRTLFTTTIALGHAFDAG